jgi:DNA-binding response OmpR family regulator
MTKPVLLVEDEAIVREALKDWLTDEGHEVVAVEDGEKALEVIGKQEFGVVVLDVKLPGKDGIQVLKEAKEQTPTLKAIIITAYPTVDTAVEAMKAGAMEYLTKPFSPEALEQLIEQAIKAKPMAAPQIVVEEKKEKVSKRGEEIATSLQRGQKFFKGGDYASALKEFENVLAVAPGNLETRVWIRKAKSGAIEPVVEEAAEEVEEAGKPKPCVWMKMGVVTYRMCDRNYDCLTCEFDQQMQTAGESPEIAAALERLKALPGNQRLCRFALRGEVSYRLCSRLFECVNCEFYQIMEDATERKLAKLAARREALKKKEAKT